MPNIRTRKDSVAIDTVPLPERKAKGIIKKVGEKYILEVEERKIEIPVGPAMSEAEVKRFIGKEVTAFFSATRPSLASRTRFPGRKTQRSWLQAPASSS